MVKQPDSGWWLKHSSSWSCTEMWAVLLRLLREDVHQMFTWTCNDLWWVLLSGTSCSFSLVTVVTIHLILWKRTKEMASNETMWTPASLGRTVFSIHFGGFLHLKCILLMKKICWLSEQLLMMAIAQTHTWALSRHCREVYWLFWVQARDLNEKL